jgi:hypothetical protein
MRVFLTFIGWFIGKHVVILIPISHRCLMDRDSRRFSNLGGLMLALDS